MEVIWGRKQAFHKDFLKKKKEKIAFLIHAFQSYRYSILNCLEINSLCFLLSWDYSFAENM